jgi:2-hydroxy-6-oxonona-2,4-dienedioate hydrolase
LFCGLAKDGGMTIWTDIMGVELAQRFVHVNGVRTRVLEAGQGEPLVLLHGTGGHAEAYARNIAAHAKHFHVYAIDMVGHGYSDAPELEYTIDDFVKHLGDFLDTLGIERAMISGESLGAMVGAWFAIRNPARVNKLVMNTGLLMSRTEEGKKQLADLLERSKRAAGGLTREAVRTRMEWLMNEPKKSLTDELVEVRYAIYSQPGRASIMARIARSIAGGLQDDAWVARWSEAHHMRGIRCPTLVLWSGHNPGLDAGRAALGAREIPNHRVAILGDSGHWPQWEQPEEFNRLHIDFLSE